VPVRVRLRAPFQKASSSAGSQLSNPPSVLDSVAFWQQNGEGRLVDSLVGRSYNTSMMKQRAKRTDRNHIIYELVLPLGNYIGVTAKTESTVLKSVRSRAAKHFYRAKTETKNWLLCEALRGLESKEDIEIRVHEIVRGKADAHKREVEIRRTVRPTLNTDTRGD
jgi:hypothetical protein